MFDEVASQPVPDRFLDLLDQLERSDAPSGSHAAGADDAEPRAPVFGSPK